MAKKCRQDRPSSKIQGMDLPAQDSAKDPVATAPRSPDLHHLRPRMESPLTVLLEEIARSTEELEQHLPLWKHLQTEALPEEFNVLRTREVLQFQDSNDPKVSGAGIAVKTGRKWRMEAAVEQAESQLCN